MKKDKTREWLGLCLAVSGGTLLSIVGFAKEDEVVFWIGAIALMGASMYMYVNSFERKE
jgi:1,4-dihydroxy-2-naphthoate octaprenyltransferase